MRIGAHASIAGGFHTAVEEQHEYGGTCGQLFTHSPVVWQPSELSEEEHERFVSLTNAHDIGPWVIHSAYLVNLSSPDTGLRERSVRNLQHDIDVAAALGAGFVNVHLGAHTGAGVAAGLDNAVAAVDQLDIPSSVRLLIETDAGAGTKLGGEFGHLASILDRSRHELGVCLDTAHAWAAGHDLASAEAVEATLERFDDTVGLDRLACIHLNDSKHGKGTHADEHAHLGEGDIGSDGLAALINHPAIRDLPFILETPTEAGKSFPWNIERARQLREP